MQDEADQRAKRRGKYFHPLSCIAQSLALAPWELIDELKSDGILCGSYQGELEDIPDAITLKLLNRERIFYLNPVWIEMMYVALEKKMQKQA